MSIVHQKDVAGPATHALIIGVGRYPYLNGGDGQLTPDHDGMGQLSSPPVSARRLAEWLIGTFSHRAKPLGTVELLLSEAAPADFVNPATGVAHQIEEATFDACANAIRSWKQRGDSDAGNLMLFYFCGHGISEGTDSALLLADYGADPENSLAGAIDFRRLHIGLQRCRATEQCFFIDACRSPSGSLAAAEGFAGQVVIQPGRRDPTWERPVRQPIFYATFSGDKAYGLPGQASIYSEALLKALAGGGADDTESEDGSWRVTTNRVSEALENAVLRKASQFERMQLPTADGMTKIFLHDPAAEPVVPIYVKAEPLLPPICDAQLTFGTTGGTLAPAPADGRCGAEWEIETKVGSYDFAAQFPAGERCEARSMGIRPPFKPITLKRV